MNAFLGSAQYGELALEHDVRYAICGHIHYRKQTRINNTEFICNCLNYSDQWIKDDPAEEIAHVMKVIEINRKSHAIKERGKTIKKIVYRKDDDMTKPIEKVMSAPEAVERFVKDRRPSDYRKLHGRHLHGAGFRNSAPG